jgi:hypothetical protein
MTSPVLNRVDNVHGRGMAGQRAGEDRKKLSTPYFDNLLIKGLERFQNPVATEKASAVKSRASRPKPRGISPPIFHPGHGFYQTARNAAVPKPSSSAHFMTGIYFLT